MVYKCLYDMAPSYLSELCRQTRNIEGRRQLRSATRGDFDVPAAWNSLPDRLKNSTLTIEQEIFMFIRYINLHLHLHMA